MNTASSSSSSTQDITRGRQARHDVTQNRKQQDASANTTMRHMQQQRENRAVSYVQRSGPANDIDNGEIAGARQQREERAAR